MQYYQMKDLMEKYQISRDMIKYYEKRGLITPIRGENGYRLYDEVNAQKLKKILDLRGVGFSVKEVEEQLVDASFQKLAEAVHDLRDDLEKKIKALTEKLETIDVYEQWLYDNMRHLEDFKVDRNCEFCFGCEKMLPQNRDKFFVRDMSILHLSEENKLESTEERTIVLKKSVEKLCKACETCNKNNYISFPKVYRGVWRSENMDGIECFLAGVYEKARMLGYSLSKEVYCVKRISKNATGERILFDIHIPFGEV